MTNYLIFLGTAFLLAFAMIGAAVFFMAVIVTVSEFCRDFKKDLRKRKEIQKYEEYKTSEEKSEN